MEEYREDKDERRKESRERVEVIGDKRKKKRRKESDSEGGEKVFCLWRIWVYVLLLQECGRRGTDPGALK